MIPIFSHAVSYLVARSLLEPGVRMLLVEGVAAHSPLGLGLLVEGDVVHSHLEVGLRIQGDPEQIMDITHENIFRHKLLFFLGIF